MAADDPALKRTPLHDLHLGLGGRLVPFAGYALPVQYAAGVLREHLHCRQAAVLFDVSHMGQLRVSGADPARALERLVPGEIQGLAPLRQRYTLLLNDQGGILDDLMVTRLDATTLALVVNAACKEADLAVLRAGLPDCRVEYLGDDFGLLALQGVGAPAVMMRLVPETATLPFMAALEARIDGVPVLVSRSGYTGEDGFELSVAPGAAEAVARRLLAEPEVAPAGLGARDSLRLEAGLCLYGQDIDPTTTPIEAGLAFAVAKRRRAEGGFPGASIILSQLAEGPPRRRVGLLPEGRQPARAGAAILDAAGARIGTVTSGGFGPSLNAPLAMGYVPTAAAAPGTSLALEVRGRALPARVAPLPFVPQRYYRAS